MNTRAILVCLSFIVTGCVYHAHGQNDWLAASAAVEGMTPAQLTNEVIACMNFVAAGVVFALASRPAPPTNKE